MSRWEHPVLALTNPLKTHRFTWRCNRHALESSRRPVVRMVTQCNARQLNDWPSQGPDPWMWYVYAVHPSRSELHCSPAARYDGSDRFHYWRSTNDYIIGMGRNPAQARRDYARKMAWAKRGIATL